jgi:hypothetical protein
MDEHSKDHEKRYHFFVDAKRYEYDHSSITGAEIKNVAGVTATYQLYLEEEGDGPDRAISDSEGISLEGEIKHFYAVPPATFGAK